MKVKIKPVISSPTCKVICVSGHPGDILEKHKVNEPGILLVKKGSVTYQEEGNTQMTLTEGQGYNIPAEVYHHVQCVDEAEIFVMIPVRSKMKFQKAQSKGIDLG